MEVAKADAYLVARDRALRAVSLAEDFDTALAAWRLAKAHNQCAKEKYREERAGLEVHTPLAGRTQFWGGGSVGSEVKV